MFVSKTIVSLEFVSVLARYSNASQFRQRSGLKIGEEMIISVPMNLHGLEKGLIIEAVIFENGEGAGIPEKVKGMQMLYSGSRTELERIIGFIDELTTSPSNNAAATWREFRKKLSSLPEHYVDFKKVGLGGMLLMSGRLNYLGRLDQMENANGTDNYEHVTKELGKLKAEIESNLSSYPRSAAGL